MVGSSLLKRALSGRSDINDLGEGGPAGASVGDRCAGVTDFASDDHAGSVTATQTDAGVLSDQLARADLCGVKFSADTDLVDANLTGAQLVKAGFAGVECIGAKLSHAVVIRADLTDATLTSADLIRADLRGADLTNWVACLFSHVDAQQGWYSKRPAPGHCVDLPHLICVRVPRALEVDT